MYIFSYISFTWYYFLSFLENDHLNVTHIQSIDVSGLCVHPACIVSITLTTMRPEVRSQSGNMGQNSTSRDSFVMNVSGRLLMVHQFNESQVSSFDPVYFLLLNWSFGPDFFNVLPLPDIFVTISSKCIVIFFSKQMCPSRT